MADSEGSDEEVIILMNIDETIGDRIACLPFEDGYVVDIEKEKPLVQLNGHHFQGTYQKPLGTPMLLRHADNETDSNVKYEGLISNTLQLEQVYLKPAEKRNTHTQLK